MVNRLAGLWGLAATDRYLWGLLRLVREDFPKLGRGCVLSAKSASGPRILCANRYKFNSIQQSEVCWVRGPVADWDQAP